MSTEMFLIGNMLIVVEVDPGPVGTGSSVDTGALDDAIRVKKMIAAVKSGAISEGRFAEWALLREATA